MKRPAFRICTWILGFLLLGSNREVWAQESDSGRLGKISIEPIKEFITLKLTQHTSQEKFEVITPGSKIKLRPNSFSGTRLSFNYRFISFSLGYTAAFLPGNDDDRIRGKTTGSAIGFDFNLSHWQQHISHNRTKGYYLDNTADFVPGWKPGDPYTQFPDLVYSNYQGITAYSFNRNFSVNAMSSQSERQKKTAGSFMPHLLYRYYTIDDQTKLTGTGSSQRSGNIELVLGAGYYHSIVFKRFWYLSTGITPGFGYIFTHLTTRTPMGKVTTNQQNAVFRLDGRAGIGYNGKRFFSGLYMKLSGSRYQQQRTQVRNQDQAVSGQLFFGYRLNAPVWLRKNIDQVLQKAGIGKG